MTTFAFFVMIGLAFGLFAALMAFLITYGEYSRHFMPKGKAVKISIETASVVFGVFIVVAIAAGVFLLR